MRRLAEFAEKNRQEVHPLEDINGKEVEIEGFTTFEGRYGQYVIMAVKLENGEFLKVRTGSEVVMDALALAKEAKAFPLFAKFVKMNRTWRIE